MTVQELCDRLQTERIVVLADAVWRELEPHFERLEEHDTVVSGSLRIVHTEHGPAAVEHPKANERVVRFLGTPDAARRFVEERLALYERMWDGCGCKVDYYS